MNAGELSTGTVFEVKCLFAIDAIAAVYSAEPAVTNSDCPPLAHLSRLRALSYRTRGQAAFFKRGRRGQRVNDFGLSGKSRYISAMTRVTASP
jgi:hypothetical protein